MAFLGIRLVPRVGEALGGPVISMGIKGVCWALVTGGAVWVLRRRAARGASGIACRDAR